MKIISIVGARPQFVKAATVSRALSGRHNISEKIIHTGQHYDANMSDIFFSEMEIPRPYFQLNVSGTGHQAVIGKMIEKIETVLVNEHPDCVIVYGDTNSCIAGAQAAKKNHIPVAHVEAGLRSFNLQMPEERNRITTDSISDFLFCPTKNAVDNLAKEGIISPQVNVALTGDVMYDAFLYYSKKASPPGFKLPEKFALATIHRAGNTDDPESLASIVRKLNELHSQLPVVFPLHPRTRKKLIEYGLATEFPLYEPVSYFEMLYLLKRSAVVITDSGGLQKEAFFSGKHCVIMRGDTEWMELVEGGYNFLYTDLHSFNQKLIELSDLPTFTPPTDLYGDGAAGEKIADILVGNFS